MLYQPRDPEMNDAAAVAAFIKEPTFKPSYNDVLDLLILSMFAGLELIKEMRQTPTEKRPITFLY